VFRKAIHHRFQICILGLIIPLMGTACADDSQTNRTSPQKAWTSMSEAQRSTVRSVLDKFHDGGLHDLNIFDVVDIIVGEGIRVYAGAYATKSIVLENQELELTSPNVLPEHDSNGFFDPTGGYEAFDEILHSSEGELLSDQEVHKRSKEFESGAIDKFAFRSTLDSPKDFLIYENEDEAFQVTEDVVYTETLWHQTKTSRQTDGITHGQTYSYQSHPTWTITLLQGGEYESEEVSSEEIISENGWDTSSFTFLSADFEGTVTRYRPSRLNAETNFDPPSVLDVNTAESAGVETTTSYETISDTYDVVAGDEDELEESISMVQTVSESDRTDTTTGNPLSSSTEVHTTTTHTYGIREGYTATALLNRSLETVADYEETTRQIDEVTYTYTDTVGSYVQNNTSTVYRHSDNPLTRNDIALWMSTVTTWSTTFNGESGATTLDHSGTLWLTNQIEADTEINKVGFSTSGTQTATKDTKERYFETGQSGFETTTRESRSIQITRTWGNSEVKVSGTTENRTAMISVTGSQTHAVLGDWDGMLQVTTDDEQFTLSAEEWDTIEPDVD
jgi:hypothetical protein